MTVCEPPDYDKLAKETQREQRRFELVKIVLPICLENYNDEYRIKECINIVDAVIRELDK